MNNPFTTNEAKLKRQATEAGNAFREALAEQPAQPSKPWVGLTDDEIGYIADEYATLQSAFKAIEAAHKGDA